MSEYEEEDQLQLTLRKSKQTEEERIAKLTKKGEGSGTQDVTMQTPDSETHDQTSEETHSQTLSSSESDDDNYENDAESSSSDPKDSLDKPAATIPEVEKEVSQVKDDDTSENEKSSDEEDKTESDEVNDEEDVNDESDEESDGDGKDEQHETSQDTSIDIVGIDEGPSTVQPQQQPLSTTQSHPTQNTGNTTVVHSSLLRSLHDQYNALQKQVNEQKSDVETFKAYKVDEVVEHQVNQRLPREVQKCVQELLPSAVEHYVRNNLEGIVSKRFQTTPITLQTQPSNPSVSDLKGKLLEAIFNDPDENELRKALIKSIKKADKKSETCKRTKATKRRHDDSDPDDQPQQQEKRKKTSGSSSRPPTNTTTVNVSADPHPTQSTEEANVDMDDIPPIITETIAEPPKDAQLIPVPEWINPDAPSYNWFDEMVDAHPDDTEAEEMTEGSIVSFAKRIKKVMQTQRLQLSDLLEIRKAGFTEFKTCTTTELEFEYNVEEVAKALSENITWTKRPSWDKFFPGTEPLVDEFKYQDFSQPLPLVGPPSEPKLPKQYFFNKDLQYLIHGNTDPNHCYATSLTKFRAASYPLERLEDQMRGLHSTSISKYNHEAALCTLHWPEMRRWFYKYKLSFHNKHRVFSNLRILAITAVKRSEKRFGYNFLDEIEVRRIDDQLYTFGEADYHRLNLNDIADIYLLKVQGKLQNLSGSLQYDIINSILLFMRQTIIKARVEDAQLGVESYQQSLNFTAPQLYPPNIRLRSFIFNNKPFGVIYPHKDGYCFMKYDEVHKFGDQTLKFVRIKLNEKLKEHDSGVNVGWNRRDVREAIKFIARIDQKLWFREQIRTLESLLGAREPFPNILTYRRPDTPQV